MQEKRLFLHLASITHFVMVALDENDQPVPVPQLILETEAEKAEWESAKKRREMRAQRKTEGY